MIKKKSCFIIMPITTPSWFVLNYNKDSDHFKHVLQYLFIPAIKKADFDPIEPISKGSELIHGTIVSNLENADHVLCDISTLNPNVFFELGIRTALNKPLCLVKDDITKSVPLDIMAINYFSYKSSLVSWDKDVEIDRLSEHILKSYSSNPEGNDLWKFFGLKTTASGESEIFGVEDYFKILNNKIDSLINDLVIQRETKHSKIDKFSSNLYEFFGIKLESENVFIVDMDINSLKREINLVISNELKPEIISDLVQMAGNFRYKLNLIPPQQSK